MLADLVPYLRCPLCRQPFAAGSTTAGNAAAGSTAAEAGTVRTLRCPTGHHFDVARQGHVDLLPGAVTHGGDTTEMVSARDRFLAAGNFAAVRDSVVRAASAHLHVIARPAGQPPAGQPPAGQPLVVDAGAGTGAYLSAVLDARTDGHGLALDISKAAVRRAARAHPRSGAVRCDTWRSLPIVNGCADLVLNVFAPRNGAEFARILRPGGALIVVTPEPDHLGELVDALRLLRVDPEKEARVAAALGRYFRPSQSATIHDRLELDRAGAEAVVAMGPSARHADPGGLAERIAGLPEPIGVTTAVRLTVYQAD
ncbi:methyltransferase domain-containing protein [Solwaraspora sp. WMMD406]|uniref:putative RNA methyltransferase n=1 Tax=Solwaraspora sp. WMMD406 TaxID=3016095 RepID=UPI0024177C3A|nr:methyltransferase domain-containing protein [Solwaraspora sp. WMMD406]MDG4767964.1 methyltransferase domain-containing protein [Solwaraspora sp. WMMD406]